MFKIKMGSTVKDKVTGFTGIVTARCEFISGCLQYCVLPKSGKDGKYPDHQYFDEERLIVVKKPLVMARRSTGGPQPSPVRETGPWR